MFLFRILTYLKYILLVLAIGVAVLLSYVKFFLPNVGKPIELSVDKSAQSIERGKYLAHHVMVCMDCHSTRDWNLFSGPPMAGTEGKGGEKFDQQMGFPGKYIASNITPYNLGTWTDGEILRAITSGVDKDGKALFTMMPYHNFGLLDRKDIEAVIAYIRTITPIENNIEKSVSDFPMNFIINTFPLKATFSEMPSKTNQVEYGKYLVTASGCMDCHTKQEKGKFVGENFAGGFEFKLMHGNITRSANITPDKETGIGNWSKEQFIETFKKFADSKYSALKVKPDDMQTPMPWIMYAGMDTTDLSAIYSYLQSLKPVSNRVIHFSKNE